MKTKLNITLLVSYSGNGGVEVVTNNLCEGLIAAGHHVNMLLIKDNSSHLDNLPQAVNKTKLRFNSAWACLPEIVSYFKKEKPDVFIAIKDRAIQVAATAKWLSKYQGVVIGQIHNNMISGLKNRDFVTRKFRYYLMSTLYPKLDHIVTVSNDAAQVIRHITGLQKSKVTPLPNPIITKKMIALSLKEPSHQWLQAKDQPVIISIGRLSPQKNFSNLLSAFAIVCASTTCRLIIFGEGKLRNQLESEVKALNIEHAVDLPGHINNPYAELKHANVFVLSSDWEGSPTVLSEALALGTPCVATDVGDSSTTLKRGEIGLVVKAQDSKALAEAIKLTLSNPPSNENLTNSLTKFDIKESTAIYLKFFDEIIMTTKEIRQ